MAEAYATFAARGIHCNPVIVSKITTRAGKDIAIPDANCRRVISKDLLGWRREQGAGGRDGQGHRPSGQDLNGHTMAGKTRTTGATRPSRSPGAGDHGRLDDLLRQARKPFANKARSGIKGYTIPSTGFYLNGSGSGDAGRRSGSRSWSGISDRTQDQIPPATPEDPGRQAGAGAAGQRYVDRRGEPETEEGRLHRREAVRLQRLRPAVRLRRLVTETRRVCRPVRHHFATYSRGRDPDDVAAEKREKKKEKEEEEEEEEEDDG